MNEPHKVSWEVWLFLGFLLLCGMAVESASGIKGATALVVVVGGVLGMMLEKASSSRKGGG